MDTRRACQILKVREPFCERDLKRAWWAAARRHHPDTRKHHPDKSDDAEGDRHFLEAQEAYAFLSMCDGDGDGYGDGDGGDEPLLRHLLHAMSESVFGETGRQLVLDIFRRLERTKAAAILEYAELFQVEGTLIAEMRSIHDADSQVVVIRPTVQNLLQSDIYCLEHDGTTRYIPMWHQEITYDRLVVRCMPELPPHMLLDEKGAIHVTIKTSASKVFELKGIQIMVGDVPFVVPGEKLRFVERQTHVFEGQGVPRINQNDAFDNARRGDVQVHLELV